MKNYSNKRFHQALADILRDKKVKLRGLANRTNLDHTYFSKLKSRKNSPPIKTMEIIAEGLGIDPGYFLEYRIHRITSFLQDNPGYVENVMSFIEELKKKDRLKVAEKPESYKAGD